MSQDKDLVDSESVLDITVVVVLVILFLPFFFRQRFRELLAVALLGIFYSIFLINLWQRWTTPAKNLVNRIFHTKIIEFFRGLFRTLLPLKSWGVVPCVIQSFVLFCLLVFGWLLAPLYYETVRNPAVQGWIRSLLQVTAPEIYKFLNELAFNPNPYGVLAENARDVFGSLNRFFSAFILPLTFIIFSGIGALVYRPLGRLLAQGEEHGGTRSRIIDSYGQLFERYLVYNSVYYFLLGNVIAVIFYSLNWIGWTQFENKIILGLILSFFLGNLIVPGVGTLILLVLTISLMTIWQGITGGVITGAILLFYFFSDDYLIKPYFLNWIGSSSGNKWDFGLEVLILGLLILYASFGLLGTLILFPGLCFLSAYLDQQHPDVRPWVLSPLKTLSGVNE